MFRSLQSALLLAALAIVSPVCTLAQTAKSGGSLEVQVDYTGTGKVDSSHKILVVLWDSPNFTSGKEMYIAIESTSSKDGKTTFRDIAKNPVYVSVAFDAEGRWDGQSGPPPAGTSLGMYMKEPGKPEPIEITSGKTASVRVTFDDSIKMQ